MYMEKDPRDYYEPMEDDDVCTQQPNFIMISEERKPIEIQEPPIDDTIRFEPIGKEDPAADRSSQKKKRRKKAGLAVLIWRLLNFKTTTKYSIRKSFERVRTEATASICPSKKS